MLLVWKILFFALYIVTLHAGGCYGSILSKFLGGRIAAKKVDCSVSAWSEWSGPVGFGGYERFKTILVKPENGGQPCPANIVEHKTGAPPGSPAVKPTVKQTAKNVVRGFFHVGGGRRQKRSAVQYTARDLMLIIDSSGSIGRTNFNIAKNQLAELLGLLCAPAGGDDPFKNNDLVFNQAAAIKYASYVQQEFDFNDHHPTSEVQSAIRRINYRGGGTNTSGAFNKAIAMFKNTTAGVRNSPYVQKEVLILTDGESDCRSCSLKAAKALKTTAFGSYGDDVIVYALVIGNFRDSGKNEIEQYVSTPPGQHLFSLNNFSELNKLVAELKAILTVEQPCARLAIE